MELTSEGCAGRTLASGRRNGRLTVGVTPYLLEKRYGQNTSNLVEAMKKWILEERRPSVLDLFALTMVKVYGSTVLATAGDSEYLR